MHPDEGVQFDVELMLRLVVHRVARHVSLGVHGQPQRRAARRTDRATSSQYAPREGELLAAEQLDERCVVLGNLVLYQRSVQDRVHLTRRLLKLGVELAKH